MDKTSLGDRMKDYENVTRYPLPKRTYTLIRVDGKAFHTFTKNFERPFSPALMDLMDATAIALCSNISGAKFAYVQSDEISIVLSDFDKLSTQAWMGRDLRKQVSISASIATAFFNKELFLNHYGIISDGKPAMFDSRVWTISERTEVYNYFLWRQRDATKNSIQMVAQSMFSHKECHKKNGSQLQDMIHEKGSNWNDLETRYKRGRCIVKETYLKEDVARSHWIVDNNVPVFSKEPDYIFSRVPKYNEYSGDINEN